MLDTLEEKVVGFIRLQGIFAGAGRVLLAVSGGADSVALLHILASLKAGGDIGVALVCAHVNHQLRGPDSDEDERFVLEQARQLGLPVATRAVDVRAYARTHGLSLETAGRQMRLAALREMALAHSCAWVSTGHQKNDNAETVLHRLWRGTGLRGLAGIRPVRRFGDVQIASPLLCATRDEIVQYLKRRHLSWREDATNVDVAYTRNYIRHRLLPFLQQEAHAQRSMGVPPMDSESRAGCPCYLVQELSELAASAQRLYDRVEREAEEAWSRLAEPAAGRVILSAPGLASLPEPVAVELIRRAVASLTAGGGNLTEPHYRDILQLTRKSLGGKRISLPGGLIVRYEREHLRLSKAREREVGCVPRTVCATGGMVRDTHPTTPTVLAVPGRTRWAGQEIEARVLQWSDVDAAKIGGDKSPFTEYFDFDRVKLPVVVRLREPGDRFQPLGMTGEKKVGKFMTTAKVPHDLRERILIFADRERILWVCPARISEQAKVTDRTQRVLQVTVRSI